MTAAVLFMQPAKAHSFGVALVTQAAVVSEAPDQEIRRGFMLATRERDGHANETSDGHLGGLDVYVYPVALKNDAVAEVEALLAREAVAVVVAVGADSWLSTLRSVVANRQAVLLELNPDTFFAQLRGDDQAPVKRLVDTFYQTYGGSSSYAALGYSAARQLDAAVRTLGGVSDKPALQRALAAGKNFD